MLIFSRVFYFALCPLILMLFIAIQRRINAYGITAERYFVFALACWLAAVTLYFIFSADKNIKTIPVSLCILTFGISFGPWGAFSVSLRSQENRLLEIVRSNKMINADLKIIPASAALHKDDAKQIKSIISYLIDEKGYHVLQPLFATNLDSLMDRKKEKYNYGHYWETEGLTSYLKLDEFDSDGGNNAQYAQEHTITAGHELLEISGFEYLIPHYHISQYYEDTSVVETSNYSIGKTALLIKFHRNTGTIDLKAGGDNVVRFNLHDFINPLKFNQYTNEYPQDSLILSAESKSLSTKFILKEVFVNVRKDSVEIRGFDADILLHIKKP